MGARASDFWRWIKGGSGKTTPPLALVDIDEDDGEERLISVAEQNVPRRDGPSADRLRRAGMAPGAAPTPDSQTSPPLPDAARQDAALQDAALASKADAVEPWDVDAEAFDAGSGSGAAAAHGAQAADSAPETLPPETLPPEDRRHDARDPENIDPASAGIPAPSPAIASGAVAAPDGVRMTAPQVDEPPLPYRLRVLSGLHAGAELELDEGVLTIGGLEADAAHPAHEDPADLALADLGAAVYRLTLDRGHLIGPEPGATPRPLPCDIEIDGVAFAIEATDPDQFAQPSPDADAGTPARPARKGGGVAGPVGATVAGLALSLAILGATLPMVSDGDGSAPVAVPAVSDTRLDDLAARIAEIAPGVSARRNVDGIALSGPVSMAAAPALDILIDRIGADLAIDRSRVITSADAARALSDRLSGGGLGQALATERNGDVVRVSGALSEDQARFWSDVERWFTSQYAPVITLESAVTSRAASAPEAPRIGLQAVWVGHDPYLIAADGRRSRPGDRLPGGWRILDILPERVRLSRDGDIHDIQLAAAPAPVRAELRQTEAPR